MVNENKLRLIALGGMGRVTQNMYLYETAKQILVVDCGIGFPDSYMPGVDILIPDVDYLLGKLKEGKQLAGMILTHGHDDHIAALPYISPHLPENFPIFASALTAGFATERLRDAKIERPIKVIEPNQRFQISSDFAATSFAVTHSVPDTRHFLIETPAGNVYHGTDFKLDPAPIDGRLTDVTAIAEVGKKGVRLMTIDCLRVEKKDPIKSENKVGPVLDRLMQQTKGKFIVTLMSSHIHRIQQVVNVAASQGRKIAFIGRSVEQNVRVASELKQLKIPQGMQVDKRDTDQIADQELCLVVAGSQGQEGSSLTRAIFGEHPTLQISERDMVVFSADAIPGNEVPYYMAVDELSRNGIKVVYPEIEPDIHQSGHASRPEQAELLNMVKPQLVMPIGGADRHRRLFADLVASPAGYTSHQILLPNSGDVLAITPEEVRVEEQIRVVPKLVDGLGIGDVGPAVLSDRRNLSQAGMIVLIVPRRNKKYLFDKIQVISRGFVFMKEADEVVEFIKQVASETINSNRKASDDGIRRQLERKLSRRLYKIIQREPVILPVMVDF